MTAQQESVFEEMVEEIRERQLQRETMTRERMEKIIARYLDRIVAEFNQGVEQLEGAHKTADDARDGNWAQYEYVRRDGGFYDIYKHKNGNWAIFVPTIDDFECKLFDSEGGFMADSDSPEQLADEAAQYDAGGYNDPDPDPQLPESIADDGSIAIHDTAERRYMQDVANAEAGIRPDSNEDYEVLDEREYEGEE